MAYPAVIPGVIGVGATWDANVGNDVATHGGAIDYTTDVDRIAAYTQRHFSLLDILAPGGFITGIGSGTSYSTPHVTAAIAIARQMKQQFQGGGMTPSQVLTVLRDTGVPQTDGDDEVDNVNNTGYHFPRLNVKGMAYEFLEPGVPDLKAASDWGFSETDNITGDKTPTFEGIAPADSHVWLYVYGLEVAHAQANSVGAYSITPTADFSTGPKSITIKLAENDVPEASRTIASDPITVTIADSDAVTISGTTSFNARLSETLVVSGSSVANTGNSTLTANWGTGTNPPRSITKSLSGAVGITGLNSRSAADGVTYDNNGGTTNFDVNTGTVNNAASSNWTVVVTTGKVVFNALAQNLAHLDIKAGAIAEIAFTQPVVPQGQTVIPYKVLHLRDLDIANTGGSTNPTGKLDLMNNALIWDYSGTSPAQGDLRNWIIAGRGGTGLGKTWNGLGITSSTAGSRPTNSRSVGYADNVALPLGPYTIFMGHNVDNTTIVARYTITGDTNLDGVVDNSDSTVIGANFGPGKPFWALGDADYNGAVDNDDITLLGVYYNANFDLDVHATSSNY